MRQMIFIACGGALGAVTRFGISRLITQLIGGIFPWGTLIVNFIGLFLIGALFELFERVIVSVEIRVFLTVGFLGGLTTFSTYGLETLNLLRDGQLKLGLLNMVVSNIAGLVFVVAGMLLARHLIRV